MNEIETTGKRRVFWFLAGAALLTANCASGIAHFKNDSLEITTIRHDYTNAHL